MDSKKLTSINGAPVGDNTNSLTAGSRGPMMLQDPWFLEKRYEPKDDKTDDCFRQAGDLYRLMREDQKQVLADNTVRNMNGVTDNVKYRRALFSCRS